LLYSHAAHRDLHPFPTRRSSDLATDGATAKQRALRPAQDFHTVHVHEVHLRAHGEGLIDVVHVDADTRLEGKVEVVLPDTADEGGHGVAECGLGGPE